jgi:hypothetical protein
MRAVILLPDHRVGPDRWTRMSLFLRNRAALRRQCSVCGAHARETGIDHLEHMHVVVPHERSCRCRLDVIAAYIVAHGLEWGGEQHRAVVVDVDPDEEAY